MCWLWVDRLPSRLFSQLCRARADRLTAGPGRAGPQCASTDLTTSTAEARTLGSRPVTDMLAVNEPSMLNTTHSV